MTPSLVTVVADVETAIAGGDAQRRREMLRRMTGLLVGQAAELNEEQVSVFDLVIQRLAHEIEASARAELAERLADIDNAPRTVIRDLAFDRSIEVARPVLERSNRLSDDDLVQVAEERGQGHLMALTRRATLSERVTDALLVRGSDDVARSVAGNRGARFSERGHADLLDRATDDPTLRSQIEGRTDVPPAYRNRLIALAQRHASQALAKEFGDAAEGAVDKAGERLKAPARDGVVHAAEASVGAKIENDELNEFMVTRWLQSGCETEALIALARLAGVPSQVALQAYEAEAEEPLLMLVRAARCGWRTLKLLMTLKAGTPPSAAAMQGTLEAFQNLSIAAAQRVMRFSASQLQALQ